MYIYFHADIGIPWLRYEPHIGKFFLIVEGLAFTNSLKKNEEIKPMERKCKS